MQTIRNFIEALGDEAPLDDLEHGLVDHTDWVGLVLVLLLVPA